MSSCVHTIETPSKRHKKRRSSLDDLRGGIRRRPTLPGRFQPSTISVLRLNFCVRDGNRWIPQAIVTGKKRGSRLSLPRALFPPPDRPYIGLPAAGIRTRLAQGFGVFRASHPQNRTGWTTRFCPTKTSSRAPLETSKSVLLRASSFELPASSPAACASFNSTLHSHLSTLFPRSSPRPISIIKLHTLPHFHR